MKSFVWRDMRRNKSTLRAAREGAQPRETTLSQGDVSGLLATGVATQKKQLDGVAVDAPISLPSWSSSRCQ